MTLRMPAAPHVPAPGLEQLLALTRPSDTCRGMFFNGVLEAVRTWGDEEARARCAQVSGERRFVDFLSYPASNFLRVIFTAAEMLGPRKGGREVVFRYLGRAATQVFLQSTVGKTMLALTGNDPRRMLASMPNAYRASLTFGERSVEWLGESHGVLEARGDLLPVPYCEGVLKAALELSKASKVSITSRRLSSLDADYEVRWE
jgi:uncharacterized protein (TIGR02265 family)